jgi:hypothetical protein
MKKALLTLAAVAMASSAFAQGTITFFNNNLTDPQTGALYRAGIFQDNQPAVLGDVKGDSTIGAGAGISVGLFLASDPNTPLKYTTGADAITTFRTTTAQEVFATSGDVAVTGVAPNTSGALVVRAWSTAAGSFAQAKTINGMQWGEATFNSKLLGGVNPNPPPPSYFTPDMAPFRGFEMETTVVPEPSTIALGVLGVGALLLRRRK